MTAETHDASVAGQYEDRADAYVTSSVHATGEDLDLITAAASGQPHALALDVGCGGGHVSFRLAPLVRRVVAHDLTPGMLAAVEAEAAHRGLGNIETRQGRAETLPDADATFDIVATRYSAHHWGDLSAGLAGMRRVLKPGGLGLFMDVISPGDPLLDTWLQTLELLRDPSHVRNRSGGEWIALLSQAGFSIVETHRFRLHLAFGPWVERMRTAPVFVTAIRALQGRATAEVARHFALEPDGSFTIDTALFVCRGV